MSSELVLDSSRYSLNVSCPAFTRFKGTPFIHKILCDGLEISSFSIEDLPISFSQDSRVIQSIIKAEKFQLELFHPEGLYPLSACVPKLPNSFNILFDYDFSCEKLIIKKRVDTLQGEITENMIQIKAHVFDRDKMKIESLPIKFHYIQKIFELFNDKDIVSLEARVSIDGCMRTEYLPVNIEHILIGDSAISNTSLLKGIYPEINKVKFKHNMLKPPTVEINRLEMPDALDLGEFRTNPVTFNKAKWNVTQICKNGSCSRLGVKWLFYDCRDNDDYSFLYESGFFDKTKLGNLLTAEEEGLIHTMVPKPKLNVSGYHEPGGDIKSLLEEIRKKEGINFSPGDKSIKLEIAKQDVKKPSMLEQFSLKGEMFDFVIDSKNRLEYVEFYNGLPCKKHNTDLRFLVNNHTVKDENDNIQWTKYQKSAHVKFPNIKKPIKQIEIKTLVHIPGQKNRESITIGWWERE